MVDTVITTAGLLESRQDAGAWNSSAGADLTTSAAI